MPVNTFLSDAGGIDRVDPYVYQEFPRMLHKPDGSTCVVADLDQKAAKLADGWYLSPGDWNEKPKQKAKA